jgi:iron complex outermembrane recepter protein
MCHDHWLKKYTGSRSAIVCAATLLLVSSTAAAQAPGATPSAVEPPVVLTHVDATYPPSALAERRHADVLLVVTVDVNGHVSHVDVAESGGPDLDEAAIVAVRQWTFVPAKRAGVPVASRIRVPFHFAPPAPAPEIVETKRAEEPQLPPQSAAQERRPEPSPTEVRITGQREPPHRGTSDFRIHRATLTAAPHGSAADLLSTAPGVFVAHPEGEAVAPRVYLRGFDAEHGQDVEFRVSGIPMNQQSHIHGQGYADLNLIIPETVRSLRVIEGVYDPRQADFAVAGSIEYDLGISERRSRVKLSTGSFGTRRLLAIFAPEGQAQESFGAGVFRQTDGFGQGTRGAISGGVLGQYEWKLPGSVTALLHVGAHGARANIAGVLRRDDIDAGRVGFYDAYADPSARSQSAGTSRTQVGVTLEHHGEDGRRTTVGVWTYLASFKSRTNFTGYMERSQFDPTWVGRGDLIEQSNDDLGLGGAFSHRGRRLALGSWLTAQYELGTDVRTHRIHQTQNLIRAPQNETWDQRDDADVRQTDLGLFGDVLFHASRHVRLRGGARADLLSFDVDDKLGNAIPAFEKKTHILGFRRTASGIAFGPRAMLEINPWSWLRLSGSYGEGYRSPQARQLEEGEQAPFAKVRSYEVGTTVRAGERVSLSAAAYQTRLSYDLAFDPQEGRLERLGPTTRRGLVGYLVANPASWMSTAISATYVHATLDSPPLPTPDNPSPPYVSGQALPYVPPVVVRSDCGFQGALGALWNETLYWKLGYGTTFLSSRPLPYSQFSPPVFLLDATVGIRRGWLELTLDVTNLLGARFADTEYAFVSNWQTTPIPSRIPARHITAGAPRMFLFNMTVYL